ncbi:MAG: ASKHA domain-containing protein [Oscillospiraceae bacterium]|nr:ASKHA domain-containing protein [Oscillospiraceae bacterium]
MPNNSLGIATDIGTTTVVLYLIDVETGDKLAVLSEVNSQSVHGADVTARIQFCAENGHDELTKLIREQISRMIIKLCQSVGVDPGQIESISIAANTIMQHLVAGYSPVGMGVAPFTPTSLFGEELPVWEKLPVAEGAKIYYTPAISAYVGGDITAGLLAAGFDKLDTPALFIDIGTNGEIVLKHKNTYYCCATAAGPAFEGAEITMGMIAKPGAIDHATRGRDQKNIEFTVIGGGTPEGICGSGLLDTLAALLDMEIVDETGRLLDTDKFYLSKDDGIYITAGDIRKLQLAKAAIAAGVEVLLHYAGISADEVKTLALAGGFGSYLDLQSAARVGIFPTSMLQVATACGNTSGEGAVLALGSKEAKKQLEEIRDNCEYIELSSMTFFNDKFVEQMMF